MDAVTIAENSAWSFVCSNKSPDLRADQVKRSTETTTPFRISATWPEADADFGRTAGLPVIHTNVCTRGTVPDKRGLVFLLFETVNAIVPGSRQKRINDWQILGWNRDDLVKIRHNW
jgi:hypothetical protein